MGKKRKQDVLTVTAEDGTFTLGELIELCVKAKQLGVPDGERLRFDTSTEGLFDFAVTGLLLERAYVPMGPFESVTDEDKAEEQP